jgi:hypothetical protein
VKRHRRIGEQRRIQLTLTRQGARFLGKLLASGLYGRSLSEAARRLIEEGLQQRVERPRLEVKP